MTKKVWKVTYQDVPYNHTDPQALVIQADTIEAALVTAYDHLTRQGRCISVDSVAWDLGYHRDPGLNRCEIDWEIVKSLGWPTQSTTGSTHIRSITAYTPFVTGRVL